MLSLSIPALAQLSTVRKIQGGNAAENLARESSWCGSLHKATVQILVTASSGAGIHLP